MLNEKLPDIGHIFYIGNIQYLYFSRQIEKKERYIKDNKRVMSKKNTNKFINFTFYELNFIWLLNLSVDGRSVISY